jgi:hypothetical protein
VKSRNLLPEPPYGQREPESLLFRRQRSWSAIFVGRDKCKRGFGDLVPDFIGSAAPPRLDSDRHRRSADVYDICVETHFITDKNRLMEYHCIHGNGCASAPASPTCGICRGQVHLRHQPAAKNVTGWICISRHCDRTDERFAFGWSRSFGHKECAIACAESEGDQVPIAIRCLRSQVFGASPQAAQNTGWKPMLLCVSR